MYTEPKKLYIISPLAIQCWGGGVTRLVTDLPYARIAHEKRPGYEASY